MTVGAKVLAASAVDLFTQPQILVDAKKGLSGRLAAKTYRPLIPEGTPPPTHLNRKTMEKYRPLMESHYEGFSD